ncbi:MAG TPA: Fic family protein [Mariniphaga anaerophila]|uniref:Fic family protein n=1 Tax=Mariniphaga anaerophila TaxID=1484053 RepID=A0A831LMW3_9BACT|nr:Fic family protein [Mariniphaga anaerophila]
MKESHKLELLPPKINYTLLVKEISEANRILGSLTGLLANIPNQSLLISPLLTKEAVASSKIEGTQATIEEVLKYEAEGKSSQKDSKEQDIREIINYRTAIQTAIKLLRKRPIGENFIKELHSILLDSVRGANKDKGHFRKVPVYIGKPGATIENAIYIPPAASAIQELVSNWEKYVNSNNEPDILVQVAIAHYQFEAIHPFLDGNGRIGRLLIPIILYEKGVLSYPILYLSEYFERNRVDYYSYLRKVDKENDWESWIKYFLKSIKEQSLDTKAKVEKMLEIYKSVKEKLSGFNSQYAIQLLDIIFENPVTSFRNIKSKIKSKSYQTIYNLLSKFEEEYILIEITGGRRNKIYVFEELMKIIR